MTPHGLVILDRDGTLIDIVRDEETGFVGVAFHPSQLRLLSGVVEGLTLLRDAGFVFAMATNQPGPAKGQFSRDAVERTNGALIELLAESGVTIAHVAVCMHHEKGGTGGDPTLVGDCPCRKPKPGLLLECLTAAKVGPANAWMIGDSPGDVRAAKAAGVRSAMVFDTKRCELCPLRNGPSERPDVQGANLAAIARAILAMSPQQ